MLLERHASVEPGGKIVLAVEQCADLPRDVPADVLFAAAEVRVIVGLEEGDQSGHPAGLEYGKRHDFVLGQVRPSGRRLVDQQGLFLALHEAHQMRVRLGIGEGGRRIAARGRYVSDGQALLRHREPPVGGLQALDGRAKQLLHRCVLAGPGAQPGGDREQPLQFFGTLCQHLGLGWRGPDRQFVGQHGDHGLQRAFDPLQRHIPVVALVGRHRQRQDAHDVVPCAQGQRETHRLLGFHIAHAAAGPQHLRHDEHEVQSRLLGRDPNAFAIRPEESHDVYAHHQTAYQRVIRRKITGRGGVRHIVASAARLGHKPLSVRGSIRATCIAPATANRRNDTGLSAAEVRANKSDGLLS